MEETNKFESSKNEDAQLSSQDMLKKLATNALREYDHLVTKYNGILKLCEEQKQKLQNTESDLQQLSQVSEAVYTDYGRLEDDYNIEQKCRNRAETWATKVLKENVHLKRQSLAIVQQAGLSLHEMDITLLKSPLEPLEETTGAENNEIKHTSQLAVSETTYELEIKYSELNKEVSTLQLKLETVEREKETALDEVSQYQKEAIIENEKFIRELTEHQQTKDSLVSHQKMVEQFEKVNTLIHKELKDLETKYEEESLLRLEAEEYASKMMREKQVAYRQSTLLMQDVMGHDKLTSALKEVASLTTQLEEMKHHYETKIKGLEEELGQSSDAKHLEDLEYKLGVAGEANQALEERLRLAESRAQELEKQNKKLENDLTKSMLKPIPPPPPPPPPPPIMVAPLQALRDIIGRKKSKRHLDRIGANRPKEDDKLQGAMQNMFERIKKGEVPKLRPVKRDDDENKAGNPDSVANQLGSMLSTLKKRNVVRPGLAACTDQSSDLLNKLRTRREQIGDSVAVPDSPPPLGSSSIPSAKINQDNKGGDLQQQTIKEAETPLEKEHTKESARVPTENSSSQSMGISQSAVAEKQQANDKPPANVQPVSANVPGGQQTSESEPAQPPPPNLNDQPVSVNVPGGQQTAEREPAHSPPSLNSDTGQYEKIEPPTEMTATVRVATGPKGAVSSGNGDTAYEVVGMPSVTRENLLYESLDAVEETSSDSPSAEPAYATINKK